jgi:Asp/Glu/hydantoin racemase
MRLLLINPNSSTATTAMMVAMAAAEGAAAGIMVTGITATRAPPMITTGAALDAAAAEVVEIGLRESAGHDGVIVAAFGDPGLAALRATKPAVVGICEAAMIEAGACGRRFAVASTTPDLVARIDASAATLGLSAQYAGTWLTPGDPSALVANPALLEAALAEAVAACLREGRAAAVIIGGGPLSAAAAALADRFTVPVIAPVAAAVRLLRTRITP